MPKVTFLPDQKSVFVAPHSTLLDAAKEANARVGHACGGVCACSTCHVWVRKGLSSLSEQTDEESDVLDKAFDVRPESRLACQAEVLGEDVVVEVTPESMQAYLDEHPEARVESEGLR